jgi:hypothetical protein
MMHQHVTTLTQHCWLIPCHLWDDTHAYEKLLVRWTFFSLDTGGHYCHMAHLAMTTKTTMTMTTRRPGGDIAVPSILFWPSERWEGAWLPPCLCFGYWRTRRRHDCPLYIVLAVGKAGGAWLPHSLHVNGRRTRKDCHILELCPSRPIISGPDMGYCHNNSYGNYALIISCTIVCTYASAICHPPDLMSTF